jgi:hypothetical protein
VIHGYRGAGIWNDHTPGEGELRVGINSETGQLWLIPDVEPSPRILIADELLWTVVHHPMDSMPGVTLEWQPLVPCPEASCCQLHYPNMRANKDCFYGAKLVFDTAQRKLIYIVREYDAPKNAWWARWPD